MHAGVCTIRPEFMADEDSGRLVLAPACIVRRDLSSEAPPDPWLPRLPPFVLNNVTGFYN